MTDTRKSDAEKTDSINVVTASMRVTEIMLHSVSAPFFSDYSGYKTDDEKLRALEQVIILSSSMKSLAEALKFAIEFAIEEDIK